MVLVHLLISIGLGIYAIIHNFRDAPKYIDECASGSEDPSVLKSCEDGSKLFKGVMIAVFIFVWLLEFCQFFIYFISVTYAHLLLLLLLLLSGACWIIHSYANQLRDEQADKDTENW